MCFLKKNNCKFCNVRGYDNHMRPVLFFIIKTFWHFIYISKLCKWHRRHQRSVDTNEKHGTGQTHHPRRTHATRTLSGRTRYRTSARAGNLEGRTLLCPSRLEKRFRGTGEAGPCDGGRTEEECVARRAHTGPARRAGTPESRFRPAEGRLRAAGAGGADTLSEWLDLVERLPSSQNAEAVLLVNTLLLIYRHPTDEEFARLQHLGHKEPGPTVAFAAPVYDVSGNAHVSIGMPSASKES